MGGACAHAYVRVRACGNQSHPQSIFFCSADKAMEKNTSSRVRACVCLCMCFYVLSSQQQA